MQIINVIGAVVFAAVVFVVLGFLLARRAIRGPGVTDPEERVSRVELDSLREERSALITRLAVEEQRSSRLPDLENGLAERVRSSEALAETKAIVEKELATTNEALTRTETTVLDLKTRLSTAEQAREEADFRLEIIRTEKGKLDETLASRTEALSRVEAAIEDIRVRLETEQKAHKQTAGRLEIVTHEKSEVESLLAQKGAVLLAKSEAADNLRAQFEQTAAALGMARDEIGELNARRATLQETLDQERKQADAKLSLLADAKERMTQEFMVLANDVMTLHGESFSRQNKEQIDAILAPLREKLGEFQQGLQNAHAESGKERATLAEQIRYLSENSAKMTLETSNLTRALKGEAQTQGAWGEMILGSILERSGLREGEEYVVQENHVTEVGNQLRSDVVVNLPGGQRIVIDSKVSLTAFSACVNADTEVDRAMHLTRHLASMRAHIKTLASKEYHSAAGSQLDYVVMFVPIEGALAAALQEDPNLTVFAVENNVAIATPTTLMIALRTVANVWQVERRNRNAELIALRAGKIYDKLAGFIEDMSSLGIRLDQARTSFDGAMGRLSSGKGNLLQQVEQLKALGAKTNKTFPGGLLDGDDSEAVAA